MYFIKVAFTTQGLYRYLNSFSTLKNYSLKSNHSIVFSSIIQYFFIPKISLTIIMAKLNSQSSSFVFLRDSYLSIFWQTYRSSLNIPSLTYIGRQYLLGIHSVSLFSISISLFECSFFNTLYRRNCVFYIFISLHNAFIRYKNKYL